MSVEPTADRAPQRDSGEAPPVFVVSTGRCGSTMLTNMIRLNPEILSLSEFFGMLLTGPFPAGELTGMEYWSLLSTPHSFVTMAYRAGAPIEEFLYPSEPGSRFNARTGIPPILVTPLPHLTSQPEQLFDEIAIFAQALEPADAATQHGRLFGWLRQKMGARVWVERSGYSLRYLAELIDFFPGARFVHLYRDGRECAYSMSRSGAFRLGAVWLKLQEALGVNPYLEEVPASVDIPESLKPLMPGAFNLASFEDIDLPVEDFGRTWSEQVLLGLDVLERLPAGRRMDLSYEDLTADLRGSLSRLAEFIGVEAPAAWIESASRLVTKRAPRWLTLPEADREKLMLVCAEAMARLYQDPSRTPG